jgi:hypothetical protein
VWDAAELMVGAGCGVFGMHVWAGRRGMQAWQAAVS